MPPLPRIGNYHYFLYPSYVPDFRDMRSVFAHWEARVGDAVIFKPGLGRGGICGIPLSVPEQYRWGIARANIVGGKGVYGLECGNQAGEVVKQAVGCIIPARPPAYAVRYGLAEPMPPDPTVAVTVEHLASMGDEQIILVVPKRSPRVLKFSDEVPGWFANFGVVVEETNLTESLRVEMQEWFSNPYRKMFAYSIRAGIDNASWGLAVTYYIAEHWYVRYSGLDTLHFVANIEGEPSFRKHWLNRR